MATIPAAPIPTFMPGQSTAPAAERLAMERAAMAGGRGDTEWDRGYDSGVAKGKTMSSAELDAAIAKEKAGKSYDQWDLGWLRGLEAAKGGGGKMDRGAEQAMANPALEAKILAAIRKLGAGATRDAIERDVGGDSEAVSYALADLVYSGQIRPGNAAGGYKPGTPHGAYVLR